MYAGQPISNIILRKHDLCDPCKILWLLILYPQKLRCGKAGKGNIRCVFRKLLLSDHIVQVIAFFISTAIVPQKCRSDHLILLVQDHQSVHLSAKTDTCYL